MDAMNPITFVGFDHNATTIPKKSSSDIIDSLEKSKRGVHGPKKIIESFNEGMLKSMDQCTKSVELEKPK
ncbi:hypothetical protein DEO72_LG3g2272 [Vigna unguiculata]|uniref:Uncharacterized protein n=1 Tax=Vigna unguiculata TaxID=3917 RepID=A0A4D6LGG5_VIGUN|nr:hypothetical protein DEO72_LG3g2272 [Vigna unguiculata]